MTPDDFTIVIFLPCKRQRDDRPGYPLHVLARHRKQQGASYPSRLAWSNLPISVNVFFKPDTRGSANSLARLRTVRQALEIPLEHAALVLSRHLLIRAEIPTPASLIQDQSAKALNRRLCNMAGLVFVSGSGGCARKDNRLIRYLVQGTFKPISLEKSSFRTRCY
jgi:hypothetical protein